VGGAAVSELLGLLSVATAAVVVVVVVMSAALLSVLLLLLLATGFSCGTAVGIIVSVVGVAISFLTSRAFFFFSAAAMAHGVGGLALLVITRFLLGFTCASVLVVSGAVLTASAAGFFGRGFAVGRSFAAFAVFGAFFALRCRSAGWAAAFTFVGCTVALAVESQDGVSGSEVAVSSFVVIVVAGVVASCSFAV